MTQKKLTKAQVQKAVAKVVGKRKQKIAQRDAKVNHPAHYTNGKATCQACNTQIECIQVTMHMTFNLGNVIKYIWRSEMKDDLLENLMKARWYLDKEIERLNQQL